MPLHPNLNWFKFAAKFFFFSRIFLDKPPSVHYLPEIARLESFLCELTIMIQIKPGLEVSGGYEGIAPPKWSLFLIFYFLFLFFIFYQEGAGHEGIAPPKWSLFFQSLQAGQRQKRWRQNLSRFGDISSKLPANQCCKEIDLSIFTALDRANGGTRVKS